MDLEPAPWRLLVDGARDGADNMALDAALLRVADERLLAGAPAVPTLRLYAWRPAAVSIGRHQRAADACDLHACRAAGVDVVRRPTGGRAVLHEDELTFAVVAPASGRFGGASVSAASATLADCLVRALRVLGVPVEAARGVPPGSPRARREACFASTARCEVVAGGRKLVGAAQARARSAFLEHGSLPLALDAGRHAALLGAPPQVLAARACGLADCLAEVPGTAAIVEAFRAAFAAELGVAVEPGELDAGERSRWRELGAALRADPEAWVPAADRAA